MKNIKEQYYLVSYIDGTAHCYCNDAHWRDYRKCEQNWEVVFVGDSKTVFNLKNSLTTNDQRYGFKKDNKVVRSITQRLIYTKLKWDDKTESWNILGKVLADSYYEACDLFKVDPDYPGKDISVIHFSDVYRYEVVNAINKFPLTLTS